MRGVPRWHLAFLVLSVATLAFDAVRAAPWWACGVQGAVVGLWSFFITHDIKEARRGRDRQAEEDSRDPSPYTYNFSVSSGSGAGSALSPHLTSYIAGLTSSSMSFGGVMPSQPRAISKTVVEDLERVTGDMPILSHRAAGLVFNGDSKPFRPLNHGRPFGVDADAICDSDPLFLTFASKPRHEAPAVDCNCGFYSVPVDIEPWAEKPSYVTLMVEVSGVVIEHEKGYRAQHQRVVECRLPPCRFCGAQADVLDVVGYEMASAFCAHHVPSATSDEPCLRLPVADVERMLPVPVTRAGRPSIESETP